MVYVQINIIFVYSSSPFNERIEKHETVTENDEKNNSNKLYAVIVKLKVQTFNNNKNRIKIE